MWIKIAGILLRNRVAFIAGVLIITIFMGFQIPKVEMSYEYSNLLPATDSAYLDYLDFHEKFGQEGNVMVFAIQDKDFYQLDKLNDWISMCDSLKALNGVVALVDITHSFNLHKDTLNKKFDIQPIFPSHIKDQQELDSLVNIIENLPFYDGTLFNKSKDIYGMMVSVSADVMNSPARVGLVKDVVAITEHFTEKYNLQMHYSGLPYIRVVNAESIKGEMYMFIILSLLITTFILYLFFRSFRIISFCLLIVLICVSWTVGVMAMLGIKITLLTAMLPPLLIVICIPNMVFMINKFHAEFDRHGNKIKALQRMIQKIGNASFLSNLTTAAGFATFIVTSSQILVEFGITASIGITFVYLVCLVMIPCGFSFMPEPDSKQIKHLHNKFITGTLDRVIRLILNHRNAVYITATTVVVLGAIGISLMKSTGYMVDDLKETDPIRQDLSFFEENFDGLMPLEVTVDFGKPKQVLNLNNLQKLDKLSEELAQDEDISKPISLIEVIKFANQAFYNGKPVYYKLPTNMTKNFILKYASQSTGAIGGQANSFVDSTLQRVRLSFRVKDIGTKKMQEKENKLYEIVEKHFPNDRYTVKVTGSSIIFFKGTQYLVFNLFTSLALAILLIAVFMAWMFKSKRMVLVALIPNIIPQIITAAIMGYFGIPIKASTILVFSIAFGISVDGTIHYLAKYRQELQGTNWSIRSSAVLALQETGQSMIYNAIILFFGFGIFALSNFGGTVALGILVSITLLAAMLSNLILLPSLLLTLDKHTTNKTFQDPKIFDEEEPKKE
ncbi:efflux RND transporter permease subunit [Butyricimonas paravirosa]|uniref:efflux RND transporter permease subunit n=1 Tax=Butyricimonas paravirosa TaxID=1472417 RepID=UPI00210E52A1|nr:MMPL family transporter [Butyricimonas paravirosa]MCQ4875119.1 MMPL family transporter [Butyricimonas paravirosa]